MPSRSGRLGCRAVAALAEPRLRRRPGRGGAARSASRRTRLLSRTACVEWLQVVLMASAGVLAARQGLAARRRGEPIALEVAIVTAMAMICIGEINLDRLLFGTKIIYTKFFVDPQYPLQWRLLAVLVVVGPPHGRAASGSCCTFGSYGGPACRGCARPWGQTAAAGIVLFVLVRGLRAPDRSPSRGSPQNFFEEVLEFVAAVCIFVGLVARQRVIMSRMSVRPLIGILVLALGLSACRGELPASAASQEKPKPQAPAAGSPAREVRVVPAAERALPRTVAATGTLAAEDQVALSAKVAGRVGVHRRRPGQPRSAAASRSRGSTRPTSSCASSRPRPRCSRRAPGSACRRRARTSRSIPSRPPSCARPAPCSTRPG